MRTNAGNVILIGLMGAGKSTIGRCLAERLNRTFYDSDTIICERTGVTIPTIFELEGEAGFRNRESSVIRELCGLDNIVLATGGGAVLREINRKCLNRSGVIVSLHVRPEKLFERTRNDRNRPLLNVADPLARFCDLYQIRDPIYRATADIVLDSSEAGTNSTLSQVLDALQRIGYPCTA